ncbi:unnamed protein product [Schistosoma margrebowiei]|uniref:Uncharacterized protein n=1 Tax=Schistosoma margrebowiei TaxID=48269 RepID=A0A183MG42_9TREM|nr:unnamed protein product [Schistosoma margrebowiei]
MKTSTSQRKHEIQWTARNQLDNLDFADELSLLFRTYHHVKVNTTSVAAAYASVGVNIHNGKSKILEYDAENTDTFSLLTVEEPMELITTVNQYQSQNLQYERQDIQFYCMELKFGEQPQPSLEKYKYL